MAVEVKTELDGDLRQRFHAAFGPKDEPEVIYDIEKVMNNACLLVKNYLSFDAFLRKKYPDLVMTPEEDLPKELEKMLDYLCIQIGKMKRREQILPRDMVNLYNMCAQDNFMAMGAAFRTQAECIEQQMQAKGEEYKPVLEQFREEREDWYLKNYALKAVRKIMREIDREREKHETDSSEPQHDSTPPDEEAISPLAETEWGQIERRNELEEWRKAARRLLDEVDERRALSVENIARAVSEDRMRKAEHAPEQMRLVAEALCELMPAFQQMYADAVERLQRGYKKR